MLILPMERTFSIRKVPVVTFLLLLLNVIVFYMTDGSDREKIEQGVEAYQEAEILEIEFPLYQSYLIREAIQDNPWKELESTEKLEQSERFQLTAWLLIDRDYAQFLEEDIGRLSDHETEALRIKQEIVERHVLQTSHFQYGFVPKEFSGLTLFTSQFLHGGLAHLLGNMIILVLVGLTVEQVLGSTNYLLFYLLSGAVGSVVFGLVHLGSATPLVGASGAISGLMGMYVAAYGRRPIRFFYWLGIYFNYVRLPALVMLPVWVGKELVDYFLADTNIAYTAHAGGLLAGAALVWVGKSTFSKVNNEIIENRDEEAEYRAQLGRALQQIDRADFPAARTALWRLHQQHPDDARVLFQLVQIEKPRPATRHYHVATCRYLKCVLAQGFLGEETLALIRHYWCNAAPRPLIKGPLLRKLLNKLIATGQLDLADSIHAAATEHRLIGTASLAELRGHIDRQRELRRKPAET